jgi:hypothetical protein
MDSEPLPSFREEEYAANELSLAVRPKVLADGDREFAANSQQLAAYLDYFVAINP